MPLVAAKAMPTRSSGREVSAKTIRKLQERAQPPSWEKGIVYDERPGGVKMPLLNGDGTPVRVKQYAENRRKIDERVKRLKTDPHVLTKKG